MTFANPSKSEDTSVRQPTREELVDEYLQHILNEASVLHKQMNSATTNTKREYYKKKFKKMSKQIISLLAAKELAKQQASTASPQETNSNVANITE